MADPNTPAPETPTTATAVAERPKPAPPKVDHLPPYRVLLHNDDVNSLPEVISTIVELTTHPKQRAAELAHEADKTGVALLLVTHKERAELYQDQFKSKSLTVTIEPAD